MFEALISLFHFLFTYPMINALVAIYKLLSAIHIPYALGFSIIALTVVIRLILAPFTASQLKTSKKLQELAPHLSKLKEKHKGDTKRLHQETMALYQTHGVNPLGGCLPSLIQLLMFPALYSVFNDFVSTNATQTIAKFNTHLYFPFLKLTELSDPTFFGIPLGKSPGQLTEIMPLILLVPILTGALQFFQSKMMFSKNQTQEVVKGKKHEPDFQSMFQTQIVYIIPISIALAAYSFPVGLALYWNTFTIFAMIQQYQLHGWGGVEPWIAKAKALLGK